LFNVYECGFRQYAKSIFSNSCLCIDDRFPVVRNCLATFIFSHWIVKWWGYLKTFFMKIIHIWFLVIIISALLFVYIIQIFLLTLYFRFYLFVQWISPCEICGSVKKNLPHLDWPALFYEVWLREFSVMIICTLLIILCLRNSNYSIYIIYPFYLFVQWIFPCKIRSCVTKNFYHSDIGLLYLRGAALWKLFSGTFLSL